MLRRRKPLCKGQRTVPLVDDYPGALAGYPMRAERYREAVVAGWVGGRLTLEDQDEDSTAPCSMRVRRDGEAG